MNILFLLTGLIAGALIGWLISKLKSTGTQGIPLERFTESERLKATAEANLANLREKLDQQKKEMDEVRQKFKEEFENLANRIFDEKSQKFTEQNRSNLNVILDPLKEKIKSFEDKVEKAYKSESAERNSLRGEIKSLVEASNKISADAGNLARALKGDQKKQGNWGELILEKVLERSGLTKGTEYQTQVSYETEEGKRIQPDVIVFLPESKHIVIDSKVSLVAYESLVNSESEEDRKKFGAAHLESLRRHVKELSEKNYASAKGIHAPDFVLMFIPIESSFLAAFQEDNDIFSYAWDRKIVMVSPSTLFAMLRTIASIWKQERQSRNVMEIALESGKLYDKFTGLLNDLIDIGNRMKSTQGAYEDAMKKLHTGSGNVIRHVENLKTLGAKTNKAIPQNLLDRADNE